MPEDWRDAEVQISWGTITFFNGDTAGHRQSTALDAPLQGTELRNLFRENTVDFGHEPATAAGARRGNEDAIIASPDVEWA
jgi:hypothetical protein